MSYNQWRNAIGEVLMKYNKNNSLVEEFGEDYIRKLEYNEREYIVQEKIITPDGLQVTNTTFQYNDSDLIVEKVAYQIGSQYMLQPGVVSRSDSIFIKARYKYEFFNENN